MPSRLRVRQTSARLVALAAFALAVWSAFGPAAYGVTATEPIRLEPGLVAGEVLDADAGLRVFRGIPYAAPPTGELRWRPPQPVAAWEGVREAVEFGTICPQPPTLAAMTGAQLPATSEDCLYLNVWTAAPGPAKRPVMVWIHGGGLSLGWSNQAEYDGAAFARKGVVLVSLNYRLGPLGFLAHPDLSAESKRSVSGNYGLLDQIAALEWVKTNIAQFGGDPDNVTIFGESAGGTSVYALCTSPLAKGLFHRAIAESPWVTESNFAPLSRSTALQRSTESLGEQWAAKVLGEGNRGGLASLRALTAEYILKKTGQYEPVVTVDGWFLTDTSESLFAQGRQHDVPFLAGTNANEGSMFLTFFPVRTPEQFQSQAARLYGDHADAVLELYPIAEESDLRATLDRYLTDAWFLRATTAALDGMAKVASPAYEYQFTRTSRQMPALGAHHAAELGYVFNTLSGGALEETDHRLAAAMIDYWVQFATTGNPNRQGLPEWPAYAASEKAYLELGDTIAAKRDLCADTCPTLSGVRHELLTRQPGTD